MPTVSHDTVSDAALTRSTGEWRSHLGMEDHRKEWSPSPQLQRMNAHIVIKKKTDPSVIVNGAEKIITVTPLQSFM